MRSGVKVIVIVRQVFHAPQIVRHGIESELPRVVVRGAGVQRVRRMSQQLAELIFIRYFQKL